MADSSADPHRSRSLRQAPRSGDVVNHGCTGPGVEGYFKIRKGGCCNRDLGPLDEDHEGPTDEDIERFSDVTRTCPNCKKEISDDADTCYLCGEPLIGESSKGPPVWAIIGAVLAATGLVIVMVF